MYHKRQSQNHFFLNWRFLTRDYKKYIHKLTVKTLQVYNSLAFFFVKMARAQKRNLQTDLGWRLSHIWDVFMPRGLRGLVPSSSKQRRGEVREKFLDQHSGSSDHSLQFFSFTEKLFFSLIIYNKFSRQIIVLSKFLEFLPKWTWKQEDYFSHTLKKIVETLIRWCCNCRHITIVFRP